MKIAIFGGTGKTGKHLVLEALNAGHDVTILARTPSKTGDRTSRFADYTRRPCQCICHRNHDSRCRCGDECFGTHTQANPICD